MAEESEIKVTYETLYELVRRERNREELQILDVLFFTNILGYLREKNDLYESTLRKSDIFSITEREKLQTQLSNIRRLVKELYERRERKILEMAINMSRIGKRVMDTSGLLHQERILFEQLTAVLDNARHGVLIKILEMKEPNNILLEAMPAPTLFSDTMDIASEEPSITAPPADTPTSPETETQELPEPARSSPEERARTLATQIANMQEKKKKVKFVKPVENFVGKELEIYGPYNAGDEAELPRDIAELLISKESAIAAKSNEEAKI